MCCFSGTVTHVAKTRIFARRSAPGRQLLVYQMQLEASEDVAMVLPLPVPLGSREDALRFIDLSGYPRVLQDLDEAFSVVSILGNPRFAGSVARSVPLQVHAVGDFEASFVPSVDQFTRLDERFRLAPQVWDQLPSHRDHGFAVFKLRGLKSGFWSRLVGRSAAKRIHPMAFEFPTRLADGLFFPTVHVHDGAVHPTAEFDHALFWQGTPDEEGLITRSDQISAKSLAEVVSFERAAGIFDAALPCWHRSLGGEITNQDTVYPLL